MASEQPVPITRKSERYARKMKIICNPVIFSDKNIHVATCKDYVASGILKILAKTKLTAWLNVKN